MADSKKKIESQVEKFRDAARELETDDSEEAFDARLKKIAKVSPGLKASATETHQKATPSSRTKGRDGD